MKDTEKKDVKISKLLLKISKLESQIDSEKSLILSMKNSRFWKARNIVAKLINKESV